jgi:hypothetical protein
MERSGLLIDFSSKKGSQQHRVQYKELLFDSYVLASWLIKQYCRPQRLKEKLSCQLLDILLPAHSYSSQQGAARGEKEPKAGGSRKHGAEGLTITEEPPRYRPGAHRRTGVEPSPRSPIVIPTYQDPFAKQAQAQTPSPHRVPG